jgi:hypothetical protein
MKTVVKVVLADGKPICKIDKINENQVATYENIFPDYLFMASVDGDVPDMEAIGTVLLSKKVHIVKEEKNAVADVPKMPAEPIIEKAKPKKSKE